MKTILVVDDMELFREPIAAALRGRGFEVVTAGDGYAALRLARNHRPDLILLDMAMPQMDGLGVLSAMRVDGRLKNLPVILLTAVAERDHVLRAAKLGAKHYLLKTQFSIDDLVERVNVVIEEQSRNNRDRFEPGYDGGLASPSNPDAAATGSGVGSGAPDGPAQSTPMDPVMELKSLKSIMTRSEMFDRVDGAGELQGLSPTVSKVLKLTERDSSTVEEIAKVIKQDSGVAIKLLRLANSVAYNRGHVVDTIDKAVARLGIAQIRQAMLNFNVVQRFAAMNMCGRVSLGQFWEHSIACGIIGAQLASQRTQDEADLAFTMGLVHDLGRLIFMQELPEAYEQVLQTANRLGLPLEQVESRLLMVNHAEAMDRVLHAWNFPKELIDPVVFHHLPIDSIRHMAPKRLTEVVTLALADRLCHALVIGNSGNPILYPIEDHCAVLQVDGEVIGRIEDQARRQLDDLKLALAAESSDGGWTDAREGLRSTLVGPFRPLVVCDNLRLDAVRMLCDQIRTSDNEAPNFAMVHITSRAAAGRLSERLGQMEREEGVSSLPTIVCMSCEEEIDMAECFANRECMTFRLPVSIERLVSAINELIGSKSMSKAA